MRTPLLISLAVLFLLLVAVPAHATIVIRAGVEDLTDKATVVVRGEVTHVESLWNEAHTTIQTKARIRVAAVLKGEAGAEIVATFPGGQVGEDRMKVSGVPAFEKGEEVVIFLWKNRDGDYLPLGLNQGKFRIETDPRTGERTAKNSLKGLSFVVARDRKPSTVPATEAAEPRPDAMPVATLERRIRDRLEAIRRGEVDPDAPVTGAPKAEDHPAEEAPKPDAGPDGKAEPAPAPVAEPGKRPVEETREENAEGEKKAEPTPAEQPTGQGGKGRGGK
jgi:hypothetical protein